MTVSKKKLGYQSGSDTSNILLRNENSQTKSNAIEIPSISLPKGGGSIKGIDEKFEVNASNGTASFNIPIPFSPNRNGFTPQLSLSYNSGTGNSLFGIGWDIGLPSIQRQTDKKLPRYRDTNDVHSIVDEDTFLFSGIEELVPLLELNNNSWEVKQFPDSTNQFTIRQYRPRIEGIFSRIERIFSSETGYYWKVTTKDNVTTFFGYNPESRIVDPTDENKVFKWLPEFSFDDKGSWIHYEYKAEDLQLVADQVHEKNRFNNNARFSNKHLKRVKYCNSEPYYPYDLDGSNPYELQTPPNSNHHFELVFDYGEHNALVPTLQDTDIWKSRKDPFSSCRSGFEIRNYRLCSRILMFHTFPDLNGGTPTLVRSLDLEYDKNVENVQPTEVTYLTGITQKGYIRKPDTTYSVKALPKMTFDYQWLNWNTEVKTVSPDDLVHSPVGLSGNYQWVDLYNEGINGILSEQANGWFYKSNLGGDENGNVRFTPAKSLIPKPSFTGIASGVLQLQDLEANGRKQVVVNSPEIQGYFELNDEGEWQPFKSFIKTLNLDLRDPNVRMLDVNGDGKPEVLLSNQGAFWWWENLGKVGYDSPELALKSSDEDKGPAILFADQEQRIFLADMSGDGLTDIVRIRNGEICYWANMGYGRFGAKVTMSKSPRFDTPDLFNPTYLQLTDISGTGATDIIYLGKNKFKAYLNFSGNAWSEATEIDPFFPTEQPNKVTVTDLLGNGTACLVWSSELPGYTTSPMRYIDLMGGIKPHIMKSHENGLGKKTEVKYKSSTHFYLEDQLNGTPWITKLPFPVQCVAKTVITESNTNVRFTAEYSYHHGYYDHAEREFRGFGRVDQIDTEYFDVFEKTAASNLVPKEQHQPPVLTKTWFHTGAFLDKERILSQFQKEYWYEEFKKKGFNLQPIEYPLPDAIILAANNLDNFDLDSLSAEEYREALRACKGMTLRQEVFGLDAIDLTDIEQLKKQATPYTVATHNCEIQLLQTRNKNRYAVFIVKESQGISYTYERHAEDPRISHTLNIETDEFGNILEAVSVVYPRIGSEELLNHVSIKNAKSIALDEQQKLWITLSKTDFTNDIVLPTHNLLRKGWQTRTFEITGVKPRRSIFSTAELTDVLQSFPEIEYHQSATETTKEKRLIEHIKTKFYNDDLTSPLPDGQQGKFGINYENYQLAYTPNLLHDIFTPSPFSAQFEVTDDDLRNGKFFQDDTKWWIRSGTTQFYRPGENFEAVKKRLFAPVAYTDPFESKTDVDYDPHILFINYSKDAIGNESKVLQFDYRTLSPMRMLDINDNISSVITDELGLVKAAAIEGKDTNNDKIGEEADNLIGFTERTDDAEVTKIEAFFQTAEVKSICNYSQLNSIARDLLQNASVRLVYDFSRQPTVVASIVREQHTAQNTNSPLQISFEYSDGLGKVAMKKVQAEPGEVKMPDGSIVNTGTQLRWVGNGRTVLNNKGNPIKQYEPYFSLNPAFENESAWVEQGVTPVMYYDAASRLIKTELPNGTFSKVTFDSWKQFHFDVNDTVKESDWYKKRITLPNSNPEKQAALKSEIHYNTPSCVILDTLGRPVLGIDHNRFADADGNLIEEFHYTHSTLDIEGNNLSVTDARGNVVMQYRYDMLGHPVVQNSMDAGRRWMLNNAMGNPVKTWDERQHEFSFEYDKLHRPTAKRVKGGDGQFPINVLYEKVVYGEDQTDDKRNNLRGKVFILYDTAGKLISDKYDFKGNLLSSTRIFAEDYKTHPNWDTLTPDDLLAKVKYSFTTQTEFDALNRPIKQITPDKNTTVSTFNPAGLLEKVELLKSGKSILFVKNIDYDAKGQRIQIEYGNGILTKYEYDGETFRLKHLQSIKTGGNILQDLQYTYDPVGNITQIKDEAQPVAFSNNQMILPKCEYTYDALYRLIEATGRELKNSPKFDNEDNWNDHAYRFNLPDNTKLRNYRQRYQYDIVGNIQQMRHFTDGNGSWTRDYVYESKNNRLKNTSIGGFTYEYPHHPQHGFITKMPHLQLISWTFKEELHSTSKKRRTDGGSPETTYYVYDGSGQRVRKVTEGEADAGYMPQLESERIYVGGFEVYREPNSGLERETLYIMDDKSRNAMIDTETSPRKIWGFRAGRTTPKQTVRFQMGNHLGSVILETDENAAIISYEEYHPFGTTAFQGKDAPLKAAAKRYRYTGMERDEETGLNYHSARYYIPWMGRWLSADPIGIEGGMNMFCYCHNNSIVNKDCSGLENIVVVGSQHDKRDANRLMFAHQGITKVRDYIDNEGGETTTMLIFRGDITAEGYTDKQLSAIKNSVENMGGRFVVLDSADDLISYINRGLRSSEIGPSNRTLDKVSNLDFFSHGLPGSIEFGYQTKKSKEYKLDANNVGKFDREAFGVDNSPSREDVIFSYACRTAAESTNVGVSESFAQTLANATNTAVYATHHKTDYDGTLSTKFERKLRDLFGDNFPKNLSDSMLRRATIDGATFDNQGAMHPVYTGWLPGKLGFTKIHPKKDSPTLPILLLH